MTMMIEELEGNARLFNFTNSSIAEIHSWFDSFIENDIHASLNKDNNDDRNLV